MTNFEKYKEEILSFIEIHKSTPARIDGAFVSCSGQLCKNCEYGGIGDCVVTFTKWLYEDDGKVDIDTIACSSCKYINKTIDEYPCSECKRSYEDKFEPKPKKTRQDEFLEMFPNVEMVDSVITICPKRIDGKFNRCTYSCIECHKDYWLQEVEK